MERKKDLWVLGSEKDLSPMDFIRMGKPVPEEIVQEADRVRRHLPKANNSGEDDEPVRGSLTKDGFKSTPPKLFDH